MNKRILAAPLAALVLGGCAVMPSGPNVMVLPGPTKSFDQFQADQASCNAYAQNMLGGAQQNADNAAVGSAIVGSALGAAAGAIIGSATGQAGQGAAIGAGTGLLFGGASGASTYGYSQYDAQRRYDMAYAQCMYARGNQLPGRAVAYRGPAVSPYPPPNYPPPASAYPAPAPQAAPPSSGAQPGYGVPPGPIAPGPAVPVQPPGNAPAGTYPPPDAPPPV